MAEARTEPTHMQSVDLEGHRYSVELDPKSAVIVVHEILVPASTAPVLVARGRWSKDHVSWEVDRLGPSKAATVASVWRLI